MAEQLLPRTFYRINNNGTIYYIQATWHITHILIDHSDSSEPVCSLVLTDCTSFWEKTVTLGDFKQMQVSGVDSATYARLIRAALSGAEEYEQHQFLREIVILAGEAEVIWRTTLQGLKFKLATLRLHVVEPDGTPQRWREWLDYLLTERVESQEGAQALRYRVEDLTSVNTELKKQLETLEITKLDAENALMTKFKDLLNAKKRKIKLLMKALEAAGASNEPPAEASEVVAEENLELVEIEETAKKGSVVMISICSVIPLCSSGSHSFTTSNSRKPAKRKRGVSEVAASQDASQPFLPSQPIDLSTTTADHATTVITAPTTSKADKLMARANAAATSSKKPKLESARERSPTANRPATEDEEMGPPAMDLGLEKGKGKEKEKTSARSQVAAFVDEEPPSLLGEAFQSARAPVIKSRGRGRRTTVTVEEEVAPSGRAATAPAATATGTGPALAAMKSKQKPPSGGTIPTPRRTRSSVSMASSGNDSPNSLLRKL
ncbi:hypothetical protein BC938DRAFT_473138 [Jimgerdemannia flammicorona]|uniref:XRCC4-like factor-domain-containing protein n=1 Tax=Jimgerdemannia flammicorona TaxID=994334 RepID=A0A433QTK0_9FUNG|nr:hypothetical protein BC938DRAFT_473138 [Jimgerdemannia flammicorona]